VAARARDILENRNPLSALVTLVAGSNALSNSVNSVWGGDTVPM
jgi:hypothetical protein